jgi:intracellular multiplication protein IcmD
LKVNYQKKRRSKLLLACFTGFLMLLIMSQLANAAEIRTLGDMAKSITGVFKNFGLLITAGSYLAGLSFSIGAVMKFKQHKDNPTQIPIGTPIALLFISASLLFLPSILSITSTTLFGPQGGKTAGPSGMTFTPS